MSQNSYLSADIAHEKGVANSVSTATMPFSVAWHSTHGCTPLSRPNFKLYVSNSASTFFLFLVLVLTPALAQSIL